MECDSVQKRGVSGVNSDWYLTRTGRIHIKPLKEGHSGQREQCEQNPQNGKPPQQTQRRSSLAGVEGWSGALEGGSREVLCCGGPQVSACG